MPRIERRTATPVVASLALAALAGGSLGHAAGAWADTKTPPTPPPVTCVGGGTVGQEIEVIVTTTLPNGQHGRSKATAKCGSDGQWHIVVRAKNLRPGTVVRPDATLTRATVAD